MSSSAQPAAGPVVVTDVVRSGFTEGHHYGSVVALSADGSTDWAVGDATSAVLPRSCNKPLQALGMVRSGLDLEPELLALACASHSGEPFHIDGVRRILSGAGLGESALQTPPDWPIDEAARDDVIRGGGSKAPVLMNCSGKHSAMLATCVANGWPLESYLDPEHPLQQAITATFSEMTGEPVEVVATDGCGAPLLSTSLTGLARAFRRVALGLDGQDRPDAASTRIAEAIRAHPGQVSGSTRDEVRLLRAIPGAIGKAGAEACYAVALPDGRAFALKIDDGGGRARPVVMAEALRRSGVLDEEGVDAEAVTATGVHELMGAGRAVGHVVASY